MDHIRYGIHLLLQMGDIIMQSWTCMPVTDIHVEKRSQNSYITLCNGVITHGAPIGGIQVLLTTYAETNANKMRPRTLCCGALHTCLSSSSDSSRYTPDESRVFWLREKPEYPQLEPHVGIKMAQVLGSLVYICDANRTGLHNITNGWSVCLSGLLAGCRSLVANCWSLPKWRK